MSADFLDTSALAKHYHAEVGSVEIDRLWNDCAHGLFLSRLSVLEILSVFAGKVRSGAISVADCAHLTHCSWPSLSTCGKRMRYNVSFQPTRICWQSRLSRGWMSSTLRTPEHRPGESHQTLSGQDFQSRVLA